MILYLDTSSLLKLFVAEEGTSDVQAWTAKATGLATSEIARVEALSAFARRRKDRSLLSAECESALRRFGDFFDGLVVIDFEGRASGEIALRYGLRALDAIHLSAAISLRGIPGSGLVSFSSFDKNLNAAARAEGFAVLTA